jgi:transcription initiation factor IIE alpha subunit
VDYTEKMTKEEIIELLKTRAKRTELTYEQYVQYTKNPTPEARRLLREVRGN